MPTDAEKIVKEAKQTLAALDDLEDEIIDERKAIRKNAALSNRSLTAVERAEIAVLDARLNEVLDTIRAVNLITIQRIDNSQEVRNLRDQITQVNDGLKDDLNKLKEIRRYAALAAKVANSLSKVAASLAKVATGAVV